MLIEQKYVQKADKMHLLTGCFLEHVHLLPLYKLVNYYSEQYWMKENRGVKVYF